MKHFFHKFLIQTPVGLLIRIHFNIILTIIVIEFEIICILFHWKTEKKKQCFEYKENRTRTNERWMIDSHYSMILLISGRARIFFAYAHPLFCFCTCTTKVYAIVLPVYSSSVINIELCTTYMLLTMKSEYFEFTWNCYLLYTWNMKMLPELFLVQIANLSDALCARLSKLVLVHCSCCVHRCRLFPTNNIFFLSLQSLSLFNSKLFIIFFLSVGRLVFFEFVWVQVSQSSCMGSVRKHRFNEKCFKTDVSFELFC